MKGRDAMIKFGKMTIELIRQNYFRKYGSYMLNEKEERNISEDQEMSRCMLAYLRIVKFRDFCEKRK